MRAFLVLLLFSLCACGQPCPKISVVTIDSCVSTAPDPDAPVDNSCWGPCEKSWGPVETLCSVHWDDGLVSVAKEGSLSVGSTQYYCGSP